MKALALNKDLVEVKELVGATQEREFLAEKAAGRSKVRASLCV